MNTVLADKSRFGLAIAALMLAFAADADPMSEELRDSVSSIVILPIPGESGEAITGTYETETRGLAGGAAQGAEIGQVPVEVGQVPVNIPIPILREIGMLVGGITGAVERRTQDLRDRLTDDLASEVEQPLSNIALATDVFWGLRETRLVEPQLFAKTTPIPPDTDAILYINLAEVTLNIQKDEAIVSTVATAHLQNQADGTTLYRTTASYSDRDQLKNWAKDDYALWQQYREFARHYLARELIAQLYDRVAIDHELVPVYGDSIEPDKKVPWHGETDSLRPILEWAFELGDDDRSAVGNATILWDLEIYDASRPVYQATGLSSPKFALDTPLEACKTYYWSVRPAYREDGVTRHGAWMRRQTGTSKDNGNVGRAVSVAHAYLQDFPSFDVGCRAR
jgi:hypothetical protein